ncbi:MAG TPA: HAD-IC family P-type ATPase, partial [Roseiflexaceae bacterium]|nr:HAD-IC family P-type ATPase [Roseiflexaceae bacterium]
MNELPFWALTAEQARARVAGSAQVSTQPVAPHSRLPDTARASSFAALALRQFRSPIMLLLLFAAILSFLLGERGDAVIILVILVASALLSAWQEHDAADVMRALLATIEVRATLLRDHAEVAVALDDVRPGDVVVIHAGDIIPGDCRILEANSLFVDEAALTGETYPVEKSADVLPADVPLNQRANTLFLGTHAVSGTGLALVMATGADTEFGQVSRHLARHTETDFERGLQRFGTMLLEVTLALVMLIFAVNVYFARPLVDAFLFALALAVGLTPQLLPAIISIVLAQGAKRMGRKHVIVKQLDAIENFGSMSVLCSDKTGTLTEGTVRLHGALDCAGADSQQVLRDAFLNASFETGYVNPIDEAIRAACSFDLAGVQKLGEVPYDFIRKRLTVLIAEGDQRRLITKGALTAVLKVCTTAAMPDGTLAPIDKVRAAIDEHVAQLSAQGLRVLGIATRPLEAEQVARDDECAMTLVGFVSLFDPLKADIVATLDEIHHLGIAFKVITGDSQAVALALSRKLDLVSPTIMTGGELHTTSDAALRTLAGSVDIFAEVEPNQKERIIIALRKSGHVVGYLGDGINDASALHAADVGISVDSAVDVAKQAAQIVLLKHDLGVLADGVREGRATFANTLKYIFVTTSANFGNMFSMAGLSLLLPFLPLLPK